MTRDLARTIAVGERWRAEEYRAGFACGAKFVGLAWLVSLVLAPLAWAFLQ